MKNRTLVEFEIRDDSYPFVGVSERGDCEFTLERVVPADGGAYLELFSVDGVDDAELRTLLKRGYNVDFNVVREGETRNYFLLTVDEPTSCPVATLGEEGAIWQSAHAEDGVGEIVTSLPSAKAENAIAAISTEHPSAELRTKQSDADLDLTFTDEVSGFMEQRLTDRQQEVLETAVANGYFEHPRGKTGSALSEDMDISQTTFSQHLRAAQRKVFQELLELAQEQN